MEPRLEDTLDAIFGPVTPLPRAPARSPFAGALGEEAFGRGHPPLRLVLAAASLGKKYQVRGLAPWMVDRIKPRVTKVTFEEVLRFAIREDFGPLRVHCVRFAETSPEVRLMFDRRGYAEEVLFELQGVWAAPAEARGHKRKSF